MDTEEKTNSSNTLTKKEIRRLVFILTVYKTFYKIKKFFHIGHSC